MESCSNDTAAAIAANMDDNAEMQRAAQQHMDWLRSQEFTYTTPLQKMSSNQDDKEFLTRFYQTIWTPEKKAWLLQEQERYRAVQHFYQTLVPTQIPHESFWQRYEYRCCHVSRVLQAMQERASCNVNLFLHESSVRTVEHTTKERNVSSPSTVMIGNHSDSNASLVDMIEGIVQAQHSTNMALFDDTPLTTTTTSIIMNHEDTPPMKVIEQVEEADSMGRPDEEEVDGEATMFIPLDNAVDDDMTDVTTLEANNDLLQNNNDASTQDLASLMAAEAPSPVHDAKALAGNEADTKDIASSLSSNASEPIIVSSGPAAPLVSETSEKEGNDNAFIPDTSETTKEPAEPLTVITVETDNSSKIALFVDDCSSLESTTSTLTTTKVTAEDTKDGIGKPPSAKRRLSRYAALFVFFIIAPCLAGMWCLWHWIPTSVIAGDALCAPMRPGQYLTELAVVDNTVDFLAPWWAPDEYKEKAFAHMCAPQGRPRTQVQVMASKNGLLTVTAIQLDDANHTTERLWEWKKVRSLQLLSGGTQLRVVHSRGNKVTLHEAPWKHSDGAAVDL